MVPKPNVGLATSVIRFRAVLFRMVPKHIYPNMLKEEGFRAVLFRMVPKLDQHGYANAIGFRAVLFRMVPKLSPTAI